MSKWTILVLSFLAIFFIGGPIAKSLGVSSPLVGIAVGAIVFVVLSSLFSTRK